MLHRVSKLVKEYKPEVIEPIETQCHGDDGHSVVQQCSSVQVSPGEPRFNHKYYPNFAKPLAYASKTVLVLAKLSSLP